MKGKSIRYACTECGHTEAKWLGLCPSCGAWNSFVEEAVVPDTKGSARKLAPTTMKKPLPLAEIVVTEGFRFDTGMTELDRVLGGGVMRGASVLLGGEPGIGKSTLMLQVLGQCGAAGHKVLYVSGEESSAQIKLRAQRLDVPLNKVDVYCETRLEELASTILSSSPDVLVIDSVQTLWSSAIPSAPGTVNQIRACCMELVGLAKQSETAIFLIGHVTKEGQLAGPKVIEHLVDTVLYFEQASSGIRLVRAEKNRFGTVDEIGIFLMGEKGLTAVPDPSGFFLSRRNDGLTPAGIAYTAVVEGTRTFLVEIQALVVPAKGGFSRIYSDRIDSARVSRVAAVLEKHGGLRIGDHDIYVNVGGGMKLSEVSIDLPLALSLWSAMISRPLPDKLVSFGELSLAGEVRPVSFPDKRAKAAVDMGFPRLLVPSSASLDKKAGLCRASSISDALKVCGEIK
ncbi:DNA repair protein RadA [Parasphaerochaeta coccoides]|uniref:DNA repair protein RadA n=1 Tax=Parasphaerochaeta coccoides (strain ATCC BAA-1237 / DSM 17374 / SPN1) TaxID=760011 RepID=F4GM82_PARC1|nr:DNA repair protein RadA [Parasphaerochaeta coccoides]AEC03058.1 DNA repair protein RadA [Parasphaerochaeta coccoides DSM 17374]